MVNYGILSAARIVPRFVQGIRGSKNGHVYAIASRDIRRAEKAAADMDIGRYYGSYEELLADEAVDVVYIPTVNNTHYDYAKAALEAHKHVILEKPFTLRSEDAEELFSLAGKNRLFLMEDQKELFLPVTREVKRLIASGEIGEVQFIDLCMSHPGAHPKGNWMYSLEAGGGALYGSGAYPVEYAFYLLGTSDLECTGAFIRGEETADNLVHFVLSGEKVLVSVTISMDVRLPNRAVIYGQKGSLEVENYWKADHYTLLKDGIGKTVSHPFTSEFTYVVDHVNECLAQGRLTSDIVTPAITKQCVRLIEQMYRSYRL